MDLLLAMSDLGVAPLTAGDPFDERGRRALVREIEDVASANTPTRRGAAWTRTRTRMRTRRRSLRPGMVAGAVLVGLASAVVALVGVVGDGGSSIVARAYAATDPAGMIVHYVETLTSIQNHQASTSTIEIWIYGNRSHQILNPGDPANRQDIVASDGQVQTLAHGALISSPNRHARCPAAFVLAGCVVSANNSPIAALRVLYRSGQIHLTGQTTVDGRRLDALSGRSRNVGIRALIDGETFVPVKVTMTETVRPTKRVDPVTVIETITGYQRLPVSASTLRRLALPPHPHVQLLRLGGKG